MTVHGYEVEPIEVSDEIKQRVRKWVAELRSGKWRQIKGKLRNRGKGRCCLGVACEASDLTNWVPSLVGQLAYGGNSYLLVAKVSNHYECDELGFSVKDHKIEEERSLADLNDASVPFTTIADIIEARYQIGESK